MRRLSLALVLALGTGCGGATERGEKIGKISEAIAGGQLDDKDTSVVGIVMLAGGGNIGECSGSLIAPNPFSPFHCRRIRVFILSQSGDRPLG